MYMRVILIIPHYSDYSSLLPQDLLSYNVSTRFSQECSLPLDGTHKYISVFIRNLGNLFIYGCPYLKAYDAHESI